MKIMITCAKKGLLWLATVPLLLGIAACTTASTDNSSEETAIRQIYTEYSAFVNAEDAESWITLWDEDGRQMFPDAPMRIGKEAIEEAMVPAFDAIDFEEFVINPDGVEVLGDQAYSHGTYSYVTTPKAGGDTVPFEGKFLTVFKKQSDGSWKILIDCFNSNGPVE